MIRSEAHHPNGTDDSGEALLEQLLEEYLARCREGERPSTEEYCEKHPAYAERIRRVLGAAGLLGGLRSEVRAEADAEASEARDRELPDRIGAYRIIRKIGRGGMGVVYEAEHTHLGRRVALKVLPSSRSDAVFVDRRAAAVPSGRRGHIGSDLPEPVLLGQLAVRRQDDFATIRGDLGVENAQSAGLGVGDDEACRVLRSSTGRRLEAHLDVVVARRAGASDPRSDGIDIGTTRKEQTVESIVGRVRAALGIRRGGSSTSEKEVVQREDDIRKVQVAIVVRVARVETARRCGLGEEVVQKTHRVAEVDRSVSVELAADEELVGPKADGRSRRNQTDGEKPDRLFRWNHGIPSKMTGATHRGQAATRYGIEELAPDRGYCPKLGDDETGKFEILLREPDMLVAAVLPSWFSKRCKDDEHESGALIERIFDGEDGALAELLEHYRPRLELLVRLRMDTRVRGRFDVSDVLQEAFLRAASELARFRAKRHLPVYL